MPLLLREICLPFCIDVVVPLVVYAYTVRWQMPFFFLFIFCHLSSQKWSSIKLDVIVYTHNHFDTSHIFIEYNTNGKWMLALPHTLSKRSLSLNTISRRWNLQHFFFFFYLKNSNPIDFWMFMDVHDSWKSLKAHMLPCDEYDVCLFTIMQTLSSTTLTKVLLFAHKRTKCSILPKILITNYSWNYSAIIFVATDAQSMDTLLMQCHSSTFIQYFLHSSTMTFISSDLIMN